ncbi:Arginase [Fasciolopsis buskii]|uniref:Arginase n=1 Tax=Fasciolopsis buskii TaxID=27845 RepID=A0A8E0VI54_9TREM|nr:Arginase [Fasciolopsis buski]
MPNSTAGLPKLKHRLRKKKLSTSSCVDLRNPLFTRDCPVPLFRHANLLGVPVRKGQPKNGTQFGPDLIRNSDIFKILEVIGVQLNDHGNLDLEEDVEMDDERIYGMINLRSFIRTTLKIANQVECFLKAPISACWDDERVAPLVLVGGDHSMSSGSILGHRRARPDACVIWVDAHADLNTPMTSTTGNMHGMPLAFLMRELQEEVPYVKELEPIEPCLRAQDIVYIGLRDIDPHEVYDMRKNGIQHFTMTDIDRMGIETVIRKAIEAVNPRLERSIHLSLDIDVMDPSLAPSTGTPVPGGLTLREGLRICEEVYATGKLSVIDLAELNPLIGSESDVERTKYTAVQLLKTCLGFRRSGHLPFVVQSLANEGIRSRADK